jgi:hypothetical protein
MSNSRQLRHNRTLTTRNRFKTISVTTQMKKGESKSYLWDEVYLDLRSKSLDHPQTKRNWRPIVLEQERWHDSIVAKRYNRASDVGSFSRQERFVATMC